MKFRYTVTVEIWQGNLRRSRSPDYNDNQTAYNACDETLIVRAAGGSTSTRGRRRELLRSGIESWISGGRRDETDAERMRAGRGRFLLRRPGSTAEGTD